MFSSSGLAFTIYLLSELLVVINGICHITLESAGIDFVFLIVNEISFSAPIRDSTSTLTTLPYKILFELHTDFN